MPTLVRDVTKQSSPSNLKLSLHVYALILFFCSLLVTGYAVYFSNQSLQIPLVNLLNNPSLYPNDPFAATLPYYSSMLWRGVALLNRIIPLAPILLALFLLERLLVIYTAGHLARTFAPKSQLAVIGAMVLFSLAIKPIVGAGTVVPNYFEQTGFSIPFFLLATASFYNNRSILSAIWLAIGFNLNSMYGVYALTYLGAVFILESNYWKNWKRWSISFGLFLLLSLPVILLTLSAFSQNSTDNQLWIAASQVFYPYHFYPHTWKGIQIAKLIIVIVLLVALLYQSRNKLEKLFKYGVAWTGVCLLWLLYACVAVYIAKSPSMIVMHPARATDLWYCFAGIALVSVSAVQMEESRGGLRRILLAAVFIATIFLWFPIEPAYLLIVGFIALTLRPVWYYIFDRGSFNRLALLLTLLVFLIGVRNFKNRISENGSVKAASIAQPSSSIVQIADWARANTSLNSEFLIDPTFLSDWEQFRGLAKRPVFVTWKDGSAILWQRTYVKAWTERLKALGFDIRQEGLEHLKATEKISTLYNNLQDEDIKRIQSRFPINYWVVPVNHASKFKIDFQNQAYKVLNLKQPDK